MSRKIVERSIWSNELRRRSPRISALDQQEEKTKKKKGTDLLTKGQKCCGIKRKRQEEGIESQIRKEHSRTNDQKVVTEAKEKEILDNGLPDKHLLELVLDVLQRRDTHELFAEPVDTQEVEEYYEIVKEPMDFGTMRAKLHEGMYNTLKEFEHDAFLIPRNALLFNSTDSVYFRQARAIDDLAKKVFHVLRTNPKKLESEFSGTRRRASRRLQEVNCLKTFPRSRDTSNIFSLNETQDYEDDPSDLSKSNKGSPHLTCKSSGIGTRRSEFPSGGKDGRRYNSIEVDRRSTYNPPRSFDWRNGITSLTMPGGEKLVTHVNQGDLSYSESLMKFAKGLGPIAQMVAKRKLQECSNFPQTPGTLQALIDLNDIDDATDSYISCGNDTQNITSKIYGADEVIMPHISKPYGDLYSNTNCVESLNLSGIRLEKVENPGLGNGFRNSFKRGFSNLRPTDDSVHGTRVEPSQLAPFAFNLSFLESKLNQMEHLSGNGDGSSTGKMSIKRTRFGYAQLQDSGSILSCDSRQGFVTKSLGGNLALKL